MKILHYLPRIRLEEGGVVRAVLDICTLLASKGHEVTLVTYDATDLPDDWKREQPAGARAPDLVVIDPPTKPLARYSAAAMQRIGSLIASADVVHLHTPWETANLQFAKAARRAGKPYLVSVHGMLDDWSMAQKAAKKRLFLALVGRRFLENAASVHCTAEAEKSQASKWFPGGRPVVIPLVFDLSPFRQLPGPDAARQSYAGLTTGELSVLFLSRLHPKKGVEVLIEAIRILHERGTRCRGLIAGSGEPEYERTLKASAQRAGLDGAVEFLGLVVGTKKVSLMQASDVFVIPTSQENFGFVFPEALACGTPVVTTKGVDIWPELEACGGALIVPQTAEAVADAIASLAKDEARRKSMGDKGRRWVLESLDGKRIVELYERLYTDALA